MASYLVISADGHAGLPTAQYRPYLERRFHAQFDEELGRLAALREQFLRAGKNVSDPPLMYKAHMHRYSDPDNADMQQRCSGAWDASVRIAELNAQGIAGEVLFPDGQGFNAFPFGGFFGEHPVAETDPQLRIAGAKAHNRWLAEFCAHEPDRLFGLAMIMPYDIHEAVAEVRRARANGLRGIVLPAPDESYPKYHERSFDPLWSVCSELEMPVHAHGGDPPKIYGNQLGAQTLATLELGFFRRRILAQLCFGGVFERFPKLRFIYTEVGLDWIPAFVNQLERVYHKDWLRQGHPPSHWLSLSPKQAWERNCAVGATAATYEEIQNGLGLSVETIMWGADYPHVEGAWPHSWDEIRIAFAGIGEADISKMIGLNAARIYNFDVSALQPIVDRYGPALGTLAAATPPPVGDYSAEEFADGWVNTYGGFARNMQRSLQN